MSAGLAIAAASAVNPEEPTAQWVQLVPLGRINGRDGRVFELGDARAVVARTMEWAGSGDLVVDYDHQSVFAAVKGVGGVAPAAGWVRELQARADGIWGRVEWTAAAAAKLADRLYRYISPVFLHDPQGRITRLMNAGLTNNPNFELAAVASQEIAMDAAAALAELRTLFALAGDAPPDAIVEAARAAHTAAASVSPDRFVPMELFERVTAQLNQASRGLSVEAASIAVNREIAAGRLMPSMRDWGVELASVNKAAFDGFVQRTAGGLQALFTPLDRSGLDQPRSPEDELDAEISRRLGHTPSSGRKG